MSKVIVAGKPKSGIAGYVYTATSITIKFASGTAYRYDLSQVLDKAKLKQMIRFAESGSGLNSFLNSHPDIKKYGYLDKTLGNGSFKNYAKA